MKSLSRCATYYAYRCCSRLCRGKAVMHTNCATNDRASSQNKVAFYDHTIHITMVHTKHAHVSMYNNTLYAQSKNTRDIAVDILKSHWEAMVAAGTTKHPDCPLSLVPVIVHS